MKKIHLSLTATVIILLIFSNCKKEENTCNWATVFFDDFQRTNGTIGTNYNVQVGCGGNGQADIHDGKMRFFGSGCWAIRYITTIDNDVQRISAKITPVSGSPQCGIACKGRDLGGNFQNQEFYGGFGSNSGFSIYRCQGTTPAALTSGTLGLTLNHTCLYVLTVEDKKITLMVTDLSNSESASVSITDPNEMLTGNLVSMNGFNTAGDTLQIDDFKIETCN